MVTASDPSYARQDYALYDKDTSIKLTTSIPVMVESAIVVIVMLLFSEALLGPLLTDETKPDDSAILRLIWMPVYGVVAMFCLFRFLAVANLAIRLPITILLVLLVAASTFWSIDQGLTFRRAIAIGMTTAFGIYVAARYNWREMLALFGVVWVILCVGSIIVSLAVPSIGVETEIHVGAWKGLWFQKNTLGGHMARAALLFAFLAITQPEYRRIWYFGLVLAVLLVFLSTSKTSLVGMLLGFIILFVGWFMRRGPVSSLTMFWSLITFGSLLVFIIITDPGLLLGLIGRDATLTGRTDIWVALFEVIDERPLLGYGYGAFWGEGSDPAAYVKEVTQWDVPTAHNGWLETWLSIGLVGLLLFAASFALTIIRAFATAFQSWNGFFVIGFILQFFLFSMSESVILQQNTIVWVTYVAIAASLVQQNLSRDQIKLLGARRNRDFILAN